MDADVVGWGEPANPNSGAGAYHRPSLTDESSDVGVRSSPQPTTLRVLVSSATRLTKLIDELAHILIGQLAGRSAEFAGHTYEQ